MIKWKRNKKKVVRNEAVVDDDIVVDKDFKNPGKLMNESL